MGVADNKSYRDQTPYFKDLYPMKSGEYPSINGEKKINSTIKENPYRANVEIEGDEIVLKPDLSAIFKAVGKKHSQGGMGVILEPESFVFSDDKTLSFDEKDHKLFELKEGGSFKAGINTPADVLRRNVKVKHYNTIVSNLQDITKDYLSKTSSARMLEKYVNTLGKVAFIQEAKKGLPDGLPEFSRGVAPVFNPELKAEIMEQKQYAKYGGKIGNPYMQQGGWKPPFLIDGSPTDLVIPPTQEWIPPFLIKGSPAEQKAQKAANKPGWYNGRLNPNNPYTPLTQGTGYHQTAGTSVQTSNQGKYSGVPPKSGVPTYSGVPPEDEILLHPKRDFPDIYPDENPPTEAAKPNGPTPGDITGQQQNGIRADWEFTPWQKLSQLYNWGQYANAKRYMPYRSHYNATYADPSLLNPEQTLQDARAITNQQTSALSTLNPILRNAQSQAIYGQELDKLPQFRSQYDNYNAQISNENRVYNNQVRNNETNTNNQFDQQYYQQSIEGRKNFDNLRSYLSNQAMSGTLADVSTNQSLAYKLLAQGPKPAYGYDWKSGNLYRNQKDIRDVEGTSQGDYVGQLLNQVDFKNLSNTEKIQFIREIQRGKALQYLSPTYQQNTGFKKGGKMRNPYY